MEFEKLSDSLQITFSKAYLRELRRLSKKEPELHRLILEELGNDPDVGDVIPGSGGWRKARVGSPSQEKGKSGGFRFIHLYFKSYGAIYLTDVYAKSEKENISPAMQRYLKESARMFKENLRRSHGR